MAGKTKQLLFGSGGDIALLPALALFIRPAHAAADPLGPALAVTQDNQVFGVAADLHRRLPDEEERAGHGLPVNRVIERVNHQALELARMNDELKEMIGQFKLE